MTTRDTHDIEEYENEKKLEEASMNIQISTVMNMLAESEPSLFNNSKAVAFTPTVSHYSLSEEELDGMVTTANQVPLPNQALEDAWWQAIR